MANVFLKALNCFKNWLESLTSFKLLTVSFLAGAFGGLAFQPINLLPVLWLCFPVFLVVSQPALTTKMLLAVGWFFGFGFFLVGLYWLGISATVDLATFWWFIPFASAGLPAILSCFVAPIPLILARFSRTDAEKFALFVGLWLLHEWLRSWVLTGFPWNLVGYATSFSLPMTQLASVGGIWLLSALVAFSAALPFLFWCRPNKVTSAFLLLSIAVPIAMSSYGHLRLNQTIEYNSDISLLLVQADIPQSLKWDPEAAERNLAKHVELSAFAPSRDQTRLTIWSESSVPYFIGEDSNLESYFANVVPEGNFLITGGNRREISSTGERSYFNSLFVLNDQGKTTEIYDKKHLVPFGEYVPFSSILPIHKLTAGLVDFQSGTNERWVKKASIPAFVPLICYEVIFPGRIVPPNRASGPDRPNWLLNITNDAWFGRSSGPYQHFAMARMRAVEEGLPLVRVSNPGISAIIDPLGRIVASTSLGVEAAVSGYLPKALVQSPVFARIGNYSVLVLLLLSSIGFLLIRVLGNRRKSDQ